MYYVSPILHSSQVFKISSALYLGFYGEMATCLVLISNSMQVMCTCVCLWTTSWADLT